MRIIDRKLPKNIIQDDLDLFQVELKREIPEPEISEFQSVVVYDNGVAFENGKIISDCLVDDSFSLKYGRLFLAKAKFSYKKIRLEKTKNLLLAFDEWSLGYYHWITETLPRIFFAKEKINDIRLLLPESFKEEFHKTTLELIGIKEILFMPEKSFIKTENIFFSHHLAWTGNYNPEIMKQLSLEILKHRKSINRGEKIFISREKAIKRRVANEKEVERRLEKVGFTTVCFEDFSFLEQVGIANNSKILIGAHGAGLTNMMFMDPAAKILELRPEKNKEDNCYFSLASDMGHDYYYQCCKKENQKESDHKGNLIVDIDKLEKNVSMMLQ